MNAKMVGIPLPSIRVAFAYQKFKADVTLILQSDDTLNEKLYAILGALTEYEKAIAKEVKKQ